MHRLRALAIAAAAALLHACASPPLAPRSAPAPTPQASQAVPPERSVKAPPVAVVPPAPTPAPPIALEKLPPFDGQRADVPPPAPVAEVDRTGPTTNDLWQRVRQGFVMPDFDSKAVRQQTSWYARHPDYLQRMFDRSRLYLYHIVGEIERRGLPTELALLPMVESAFNPMAYSRAHASGLWQFIPGTGKRFELDQTWWYDERRDIVDSTSAALEYLTKLHDMYGDWQLALAAYNWGENGVARAVERNRKARKPTDYAHLRMPRETRSYVPKLQALKNIIRDPGSYGVTLQPIPDEPYFVTLAETPDMDLQLAAQLAEMPIEDFVALNPGIKRPLIRSSSEPRLVLPAEKVEVFYDNLAKYGGKSLVSWKVYHPERGETFGKLAKKFDVSIADLKKVNGVAPRSWHVPDVLVVPTREQAAQAAKLPVMYRPPIPQGTLGIVHRVKPGDTLSGIAKRYHVTVAALKHWNHVGDTLHVGQKIYIRKAVY